MMKLLIAIETQQKKKDIEDYRVVNSLPSFGP